MPYETRQQIAERHALWCELYECGDSLATIAERFAMTKRAVWYVLRVRGVTLRQRGRRGK